MRQHAWRVHPLITLISLAAALFEGNAVMRAIILTPETASGFRFVAQQSLLCWYGICHIGKLARGMVYRARYREQVDLNGIVSHSAVQEQVAKADCRFVHCTGWSNSGHRWWCLFQKKSTVNT